MILTIGLDALYNFFHSVNQLTVYMCMHGLVCIQMHLIVSLCYLYFDDVNFVLS